MPEKYAADLLRSQHKCKTCGADCPNKNCTPYSAPNQVVRLAPVPSTSTNNVGCLNEAAWAAIKSANPNSVFLNYRLISVLWPGQSQTYTTPVKAPLAQGNPQPAGVQGLEHDSGDLRAASPLLPGLPHVCSGRLDDERHRPDQNQQDGRPGIRSEICL